MVDQYLKRYKQYLEDILPYLPDNERYNVEETAAEYCKNFFEASPTENFKGYKLPPGFTEKSAAWQYENWMPKKGDVLVATYPKTGTTWMLEIVKHLLGKDDQREMEILSKTKHVFSFLEIALPSMQEAYSKLPLSRRVHITHLPSDCINMKRLKQNGCKIIRTFRNPKDQLLSWYNFRLKLPEFDVESMAKLHPRDWDEFFASYISGDQILFCKPKEWYPHHILYWHPYRNEENVMSVYYEDLKKNPTKHIKEIAEFLEVKCSDDEIAIIVQKTSFEQMKERTQNRGMHKGEIGSWKNQFTVAQSELMDKKFKEALGDVDVQFTST